MNRHLHLFETISEFNSAYTGKDYIEPWFSYTRESDSVAYNNPDAEEEEQNEP